MKHMIKQTMLTGALSCFLLGTALADNATNPVSYTHLTLPTT